MNTAGVFLTRVVLPLAIGTAIYVGWRSTDLVVFRWIDAIGASDLLIRPRFPLPEWMLYSLPDGCWIYAATSWLLLIWKRSSAWVFAILLLALAHEFCQLAGIVSGTYQHLDVAFYIGGFLLAGGCHAQAPVLGRGDLCDGVAGIRNAV